MIDFTLELSSKYLNCNTSNNKDVAIISTTSQMKHTKMKIFSPKIGVK